MDYNPFKHKFSELNTAKAEKGNLLVAEPFMMDPYFKRSVVLLTDHNPDGTVGFILNSPLGIKLSEVIKGIEHFDAPIFLGGPVQPQNLFFLHDYGDLIPDSIKISDDLFWDGDFEMVKTLASIGQIEAHRIRFFLGYSGWDYAQLSNEVEQQSWLISKTKKETVLTTNTKSLWKTTMRQMGKEQEVFSNFPEDPNLN